VARPVRGALAAVLAFRKPARNGGDLYAGLSPIHPGFVRVYSSAWLAYGSARRVVGAWRPSSMKELVVESREQVEPKDETEPVEDLEVDADQAESVAGGRGAPDQNSSIGSAPVGPPN
jgi:hypothetical protein